MKERYKLEDAYCRVHYLYLDTDNIPPYDDDPHFETTYPVRLADRLGKNKAKNYLEKIIKPELTNLKTDNIIPDYVTHELLSGKLEKLFTRIETGEANKNPMKGYIYLLANLRKLTNEIKKIKNNMRAPDRAIYMVYSPVSGTASGAWYLITALLFQTFKNTSPVLINLMPSHLRGTEDRKARNYAIFGWSAKLLNKMIRDGINLDLTIPQLKGPPIHISVNSEREPLFVFLESGHRATDYSSLATDQVFFDVISEQIPLFVIGKHNTQSMPSADSQIVNAETDQRLDEYSMAMNIIPRRFVSRGFCSIRHNAKQARELIKIFLKNALLINIVNSDKIISSSLHEIIIREIELVFKKFIWQFYKKWNEQTELDAYSQEAPKYDIQYEIEEKKIALKDKIVKYLNDTSDDLNQHIWTTIQKLLNQHGYHILKEIFENLKVIQIDEKMVMNCLPKLNDEIEMLEQVIEKHSKIEINLKRSLIMMLERSAGGNLRGINERYRLTLANAYKNILFSCFQNELLHILNDSKEYYYNQLLSFIARSELIYEENMHLVKRYENIFFEPESDFVYHLTYELAKDKIDRQDVNFISKQLFSKLHYKIDQIILNKKRLNDFVDEIILSQESIQELPQDIRDVVQYVSQEKSLLSLLLQKGRALIKLNGKGYETNWSVWHSGRVTEELKDSLNQLKAHIVDALNDEDFQVILNDGTLPLRSDEDVELILAETILDFPLQDTESDVSMVRYWQADEELFKNGISIHRVHTNELKEIKYDRVPSPNLDKITPSYSHREKLEDKNIVEKEKISNIDINNFYEKLANKLGISSKELRSEIE